MQRVDEARGGPGPGEQAPVGQARALWLLPLIAGLLPAAAALAALWLFVSVATGPVCNPFLEGCISISRTAKHGVGNHLFRLLVLPGAALQGLTWLLCGRWLLRMGAAPRGMLRFLPALGIAAAIVLAVYAGLLGTWGTPYRVARRYGVLVYFGATYLCMVICAMKFRALVRSGAIAPPARLERLLLLLAAFTTGTGFVQIVLRPFMADRELKNRLTNLLEWNTALAFTLFFLGLAWLWYRMRLTVPAFGQSWRLPAVLRVVTREGS